MIIKHFYTTWIWLRSIYYRSSDYLPACRCWVDCFPACIMLPSSDYIAHQTGRGSSECYEMCTAAEKTRLQSHRLLVVGGSGANTNLRYETLLAIGWHHIFFIIIQSPRYTGVEWLNVFVLVRTSILVHAITFEQLFGFLSFLADCWPWPIDRLPD